MLLWVSRVWNQTVLKFLEVFQCIVGSPLFFFLVPVGTIVWMLFEKLVPHPIDDPKDYFPLTILVYTLAGLWIENAMKAFQTMQAERDQQQMQRIEILMNEIAARDRVIESIVSTIEATANKLLVLAQAQKATT